MIFKDFDSVPGASTTLAINLDICDLLSLPAGPACSLDTGVSLVSPSVGYSTLAKLFRELTTSWDFADFFESYVRAVAMIGMGVFVEAGVTLDGIDFTPLFDVGSTNDYTYLYEVSFQAHSFSSDLES